MDLTATFESEFPGITGIQVGLYPLMDTIYTNRKVPSQRSLMVLATFIGTRGAEHAVLDCGVKAISAKRGLSTLKDFPGSQLKTLHAGHAVITIDAGSAMKLEADQSVEIWVQNSDATVNLHSCFYGVRHGKVKELYRIEH